MGQTRTSTHFFTKTVAQGLRRKCGVGPCQRLLVAVSGGVDSVALLRSLHQLAPRRRWKLELCIGHVQHHLRDDAETDATFVEQLANDLDLPHVRVDVDLSTHTGNLESAARRARYRALGEMATEFGATHVVTAHQADDQLETMLMRLLRGASVRGMSAMAWRRALHPGCNIQLIRPMLSVDRVTAKQFLDSLGQTWRDDRTNADTTRLRARLREQVLPTLRAVQSDVSDRAVKLADHLRDVSQLVEDAVEAAAEEIDSTINRAEARAMPRVVLFGLLRILLIEAGVPADRLGGRIINPIVRAIRDHTGGHRTFELSKGIHVEITRESVTIESS